jgi:hypothetical protein
LRLSGSLFVQVFLLSAVMRNIAEMESIEITTATDINSNIGTESFNNEFKTAAIKAEITDTAEFLRRKRTACSDRDNGFIMRRAYRDGNVNSREQNRLQRQYTPQRIS